MDSEDHTAPEDVPELARRKEDEEYPEQEENAQTAATGQPSGLRRTTRTKKRHSLPPGGSRPMRAPAKWKGGNG